MATNTPHLNLLKKNVLTDGNETFNIETMLNENWDKIDTAFGSTSETLAVTQKALHDAALENDTRFSSLESKLQNGEPVEKTLQPGTNQITASVSATAQIKAIQGRTIVNLAPPFDSAAWTIGANATVESPTKLRIDSDGSLYVTECKINAKPNTIYSVAFKSTGETMGQIALLRIDGTEISAVDIMNGFITTSEDTVYVAIRFYNNISGTYYHENLVVKEGNVIQPFVQGIQGVTNPTVTNETNGTSVTAKTTLYSGDTLYTNDRGNLLKIKKVVEVTIDGSQSYELVTSISGCKLVKVNNATPNANYGSGIAIKYDGKILNVADAWDTGDEINGDINTGHLRIMISNTDSGWGEGYNPTSDEIRAYFLGWKMYVHGYSYGSAYGAQHVGSYKKAWTPINKERVVTPNLELPTVASNEKTWQPYRLIYELETPIEEVVETVGAITLDKGENTLKLSTGRIVREVVKPYYDVDSNTSYINAINSIAASKSWLRNQSNNILNISSSDGIVWNVENTVYNGIPYSYGKYTGKASDAATYTVDYEPLYPFQVTAPIDSITIEYQSNLGGVVEQLVSEVAINKSDISTLQTETVKRDEPLEWVNLTLLNVSVGYLQYAKDSLGNVFLRGRLDNYTHNDGALIAVLPVGFRPSVFSPIHGSLTNRSPFGVEGVLTVNIYGQINLAYGTSLTGAVIADGGVIIYGAFKTEL